MILSEEDRRELARNFPGRCVSRYWLLAFSTLHHGFSLKSLYRNCQDHDGPSLLVIQSKDQVGQGEFSYKPNPNISLIYYYYFRKYSGRFCLTHRECVSASTAQASPGCSPAHPASSRFTTGGGTTTSSSGVTSPPSPSGQVC